jgi:hypothetical protein
MKDYPHILNFGLHSGFEDFKEPEGDYVLALGDCSMTNVDVDVVLKKCPLPCFKFRIGGGAGWEFDYENLKFCKGFILINGWANGATVVSDEAKWEKRVFSQLNILKSIASQGSIVVMVDRPIVGERYIDKELRGLISLKPIEEQLGIKEEEALRGGWRPQSVMLQSQRRDSYKKIIKEVVDLPHFYYTDVQSVLTKNQIEKYSLECNLVHDVINEAPWHFTTPLMSAMAEASVLCLSGRFDLSKNIYNRL